MLKHNIYDLKQNLFKVMSFFNIERFFPDKKFGRCAQHQHPNPNFTYDLKKQSHDDNLNFLQHFIIFLYQMLMWPSHTHTTPTRYDKVHKQHTNPNLNLNTYL